MIKNPYSNQDVFLGSQHHKEIAIEPPLAKALNIRLIPVAWDTDTLGTFSGEIKREKSIKETLRSKAQRTREICKADLVLVSEGSFGPHPQIPFANSNHEMLLFKDFMRHIEIFAEAISLKTNIAEIEISDIAYAKQFLKEARFPSHGIIMADRKENPTMIKKGIQSTLELKKIFNQIRQRQSKAYLMTDMRAHMNPTRMKVIRQATKELIKKLKSYCPQCQSPGWDMVDYIEGLPCCECGLPSTSIKEVVFQCQVCAYKQNKPRPDKKTCIPLDHCEFCNP